MRRIAVTVKCLVHCVSPPLKPDFASSEVMDLVFHRSTFDIECTEGQKARMAFFRSEGGGKVGRIVACSARWSDETHTYTQTHIRTYAHTHIRIHLPNLFLAVLDRFL